MSIHTDVASLEILAQAYQSGDTKETLSTMVTTLHHQVPYMDWVGIYINKDGETVLEAATDVVNTMTWDSNSELKVPIKCRYSDEDLGRIVVKSKHPLCFDVTDVSTLEKLAEEISHRLYLV